MATPERRGGIAGISTGGILVIIGVLVWIRSRPVVLTPSAIGSETRSDARAGDPAAGQARHIGGVVAPGP